MKLYCEKCGCEREVRIVRKEETYPVKGEDITIQAEVCVCGSCENEIMSLEYDDNNLEKAYEIYRTIHGLLQPSEIKAIRESYNISQVNFARVLGVGDKTIARYENGSLQDEAINNLIMLGKDPKNFIQLLDKNGQAIPKEERDRLYRDFGKCRVFVEWRNYLDNYSFESGDGETDYYEYEAMRLSFPNC